MLLLLIFSLALTACGKSGSDGGSSTGSGAVTFGLAFQTAGDGHARNAANFDCKGNGIANVEASVYDGRNVLLRSGGPWSCDDGQGTIEAVAAGTGYTLVVLARDSGGNLLYQGQKAVDVAADTVTSAGIIECAYFAPVPLTPPAGTPVVTETIKFTWEAVAGAPAYRIRVSTSEDLSDPLIDDTTTENSYAPAGLENGRTYYWQVAAQDAYGHLGSTGAVLRFDASARIQMVKEIKLETDSSYPNYCTALNNKLIFRALNSATPNQEESLGNELWMSDGTPSGTVLVKDLNPGSGSGNPEFLTNASGQLYFIANGSELWWATSRGVTGMVGNIDSLDNHAYSRPLEAVASGKSLFLTVSNSAEGIYELWCGNQFRLVFLKSFAPENVPDKRLRLTAVDDVLFFTVRHDGTSGVALWKSDGTVEGTILVKDIGTDGTSSYACDLTAVGDTLYFAAYDGTHGLELWKSDGTGEGTVLVKDPDIGARSPSSLTAVGDTLYFTAYDGTHGLALWKSDGTGEGTILVKDIHSASSGTSLRQLTAVGDTLFFIADDGTLSEELWKSDGTAEGTVFVKDIRPYRGSIIQRQLTAVGNTLYFVADDGTHGDELWKSDGTTEGTAIVKDIRPNSSSSSPLHLTAVDDLLYFEAYDDSHGIELWKSDGTAEGTVMVEDINTSGQNSYYPPGFTVVDGKVIFIERDPYGVDGWILWQSDGTNAGTGLIKNTVFDAGSSLPVALPVIGPDGVVYFAADDGAGGGKELWKSDGTAEGTSMVKDIFTGIRSSDPQDLVSTDTGVFFTADDGVNGKGLWRTDGTESGTEMIMGEQDGRSYHLLTDAGNTFFFVLNDNNGDAPILWKSDGMVDNATKIKDLTMDISDSAIPVYYIDESLSIGDNLFFVTRGYGLRSDICCSKLWKSDGTSEGTIQIKTLTSSNNQFSIRELIQFKGQLYFTSRDEATGRELWMSDGTPAGTVLVKDIQAGESGSDPDHFAVLGDRLYFSADDGVNGRELWMSDGKETAMVKDIFSGATGSGAKNLFNLNGTLFFQADDGIHGCELWESDGTAEGTRLAADINPGANHSYPEKFIEFNNMLLFNAYDKEHGYELRRCIP